MTKKRKDGYITVTFTINSKKYFVYGKTKQEAKEKERVKRQEIAEGLYQKGRGITVEKYFERWAAAREGVVSGATIRKQNFEFLAMSRTPIDSAGTPFGKLKLIDVERQNIKDLQAALKDLKLKNGSPKYKTNTINGMISLLNHIFGDAVIERLIAWNPVKGVKPLKRTEPKARDNIHRALSIEETKSFFTAASGSWYYPLYLFMLSSGCRAGEAGALKVSDIYDGHVHIERTITKDAYGLYHIGANTKTDSGVRSIPYTDDIRSAVEKQKAANIVMFGNIIPIDGHLFASPTGSLLNETVVNRDIKKICEAAGIDRFTSHAFRDTFATRAVEGGMNPKTLQEILGHADISVTMNLYAHVMENTKITEMQLVKTGL